MRFKHVFKWRMDKSSKLNLAIEILGGRPAFAAELGVSPQLVWNWLHRDQKVPAQHCPAIERLTGGRVVCEDFWPDADWAYIRSSRNTKPLPRSPAHD